MKKTILAIQNLCRDLQAMTPKQRVEHIWYHFKWHILAVICCIAVVISLCVDIAKGNQQELLGGGILNITLSDSGADFLTEAYLQSFGYKTNQYEVMLYDPGLTGMDSAAIEQNPSFTMSFMTMIGAKKLDFLIMDETAMNYYLPQGLFMDLRSIFNSEELQEMSDLLTYSDSYDEDGNALSQFYPVGICIDSLPFTSACTEAEAPVYLLFVRNAPHPDKLDDFYNYLLSWKSVS